jgi:hypothetical protein
MLRGGGMGMPKMEAVRQLRAGMDSSGGSSNSSHKQELYSCACLVAGDHC